MYTVAWRYNDRDLSASYDSLAMALHHYYMLDASGFEPTIHFSPALEN